MSNAAIRNYVILSLLGVVALIVSAMAGCPVYKVYVQGKEGEAELKRAEQNRQIVVQSAQALQEAAEFEKEAEITKAEGVAEALRTMKEELQDLTDEQARVLILYNWVRGLNDESSQVIYVPTESNLPLLLEAGRIANTDGPARKVGKIDAELQRDVVEEGRESSKQIKE